MSDRINCEDCQFFKVTGSEWFYLIGNCEHPKPELGGAMVNLKDIAGFLTCYQAKKRRLTKQKGTKNDT